MANNASLLRLPPEVHDLILKELPLSSHLLYKTQVCSALRMLFDGQLRLNQSYRFDLVVWKRAQAEVGNLLARQSSSHLQSQENQGKWTKTLKNSIWDTSPTSTPRPAPAKFIPQSNLYSGSVNLQRKAAQIDNSEIMLIHRDHPDVSFFIYCMQILGKMNSDKVEFGPLPRLRSDKITVLSLLCRNGFKVASLIQLLETQPSLYYVETVFMTTASFIDAVLWTAFTPPQAKQTRKDSSTRSSIHFDLEFSESTCIDTAAIVIPGPLSEKGQGLRSGFKCLCFSNFEKSIPFHVIFHDYYTEEEAIGTQDMLTFSDISCNTCKQKIRY